MKKMNENQLQNLEGGKFWGWSCGRSYSIEPGSCYQNCTHYVFWINNDTDYAVPCGTH
jgi:hypothetical protein